MSLRIVNQKCCSEESIRKSVAQFRSVDQALCKSVAQKFDEKCGSQVLLRSVEKGSSKVSIRIVDQKCCSEVSQQCSEVLLISVNQKCGSTVLLKLSIRSVKQKCGVAQV